MYHSSMSAYKILDVFDDIVESYKEPVERVSGLTRDPKEIIRTVEFYSNDKYLNGQVDELNREKPFINQGNSRVRTAKTATDIDVKDIVYTPDSLEYATEAMLYNKEVYNWFKEANFSQTLNDMGLTRPKYGHLLVKKVYDENKKMKIDVVDWVNVEFDPATILGSPVVETHYLDPSELVAKKDVWNEYDSISDVIEASDKKNKGKPVKIVVKEITGTFNANLDPNEDETDDTSYKTMCFYLACVGSKKFLLYKEDLKSVKDKYRDLAWEKIGTGFGRGVWEEGFESQVWSNDQYIQLKNHLDLSGKVFTKGTVKGIGNAIVGVDNGHHFELTMNDTLEAFQLSTGVLPQFTVLIEQFKKEYDRISSTFDANTGEQPPSGTPLGQTQLLNQVANSPFQYQQEVWAIWLNELLNDWVLPEVKKRIKKSHDLIADFSEEELEIIDEDMANDYANNKAVETILGGEVLPEGAQAAFAEEAKRDLRKKHGKRRQLKIPEGYLDIEGKLTANITGELKNKGAILASFDSMLKTVVSSFNPTTGKYGVLEDPTLRKIFAQAVEIAGIPFSSAQLGKPGAAQATSMQADLTGMSQPAQVA